MSATLDLSAMSGLVGDVGCRCVVGEARCRSRRWRGRARWRCRTCRRRWTCRRGRARWTCRRRWTCRARWRRWTCRRCRTCRRRWTCRARWTCRRGRTCRRCRACRRRWARWRCRTCRRCQKWLGFNTNGALRRKAVLVGQGVDTLGDPHQFNETVATLGSTRTSAKTRSGRFQLRIQICSAFQSLNNCIYSGGVGYRAILCRRELLGARDTVVKVHNLIGRNCHQQPIAHHQFDSRVTGSANGFALFQTIPNLE